MPFILLAIIAVAVIVVAGMSAVHGPSVMTGPATILPADSNYGLALLGWLLAIAVISLWIWWFFQRRR